MKHAILLASAVLMSLFVPMKLGAQECERRPARPWLGISTFSCDGGICAVHGAVARSSGAGVSEEKFSGRRFRYDFSVEPTLWDIAPDGPAEGKLENGDVLVAVNERAITSVAASKELEQLEAGKPVELLVRRENRLLEVSLIPQESCEPVWIASARGVSGRAGMADQAGVRKPVATTDSALARAYRQLIEVQGGTVISQTGPGYLGIAIHCRKCALVLGAGPGASELRFEEYPEVADVVDGSPADRSGLQPGDVLTHVDGHDLRTDAGAARLANLIVRAGGRVEIRYLRNGEEANVLVEVSGSER